MFISNGNLKMNSKLWNEKENNEVRDEMIVLEIKNKTDFMISGENIYHCQFLIFELISCLFFFFCCL